MMLSAESLSIRPGTSLSGRLRRAFVRLRLHVCRPAEVNVPENGQENLHSRQELCLDKAAEVLYHKTCY